MMMNAAESDDDLIEVFVEEAGEVFEAIDNRLPAWRRLPTDRNALTEIRRGFHTLKGSGRMVNAMDLAEVAWKVENMLNRVIDGSITVTEPVVDLVSAARDLMPRMLEAFKSRRPMGSDSEIHMLMAQVDALAAGQSPVPARAQPAVATKASGNMQSRGIESVRLERKIESIQQRSDEALRRSEMALQLTRRIGGQINTMNEEARDRVGRAEVNRVIEQVNLLTKEFRKLHRDTMHPQLEQPHQHRELNQLIDHRVRERIATIQRQGSELERQLGESRREAAASRSLAIWALILSALVGIGTIAALTMPGLTLG